MLPFNHIEWSLRTTKFASEHYGPILVATSPAFSPTINITKYINWNTQRTKLWLNEIDSFGWKNILKNWHIGFSNFLKVGPPNMNQPNMVHVPFDFSSKRKDSSRRPEGVDFPPNCIYTSSHFFNSQFPTDISWNSTVPSVVADVMPTCLLRHIGNLGIFIT